MIGNYFLFISIKNRYKRVFYREIGYRSVFFRAISLKIYFINKFTI